MGWGWLGVLLHITRSACWNDVLRVVRASLSEWHDVVHCQPFGFLTAVRALIAVSDFQRFPLLMGKRGSGSDLSSSPADLPKSSQFGMRGVPFPESSETFGALFGSPLRDLASRCFLIELLILCPITFLPGVRLLVVTVLASGVQAIRCSVRSIELTRRFHDAARWTMFLLRCDDRGRSISTLTRDALRRESGRFLHVCAELAGRFRFSTPRASLGELAGEPVDNLCKADECSCSCRDRKRQEASWSDIHCRSSPPNAQTVVDVWFSCKPYRHFAVSIHLGTARHDRSLPKA